MHRCTLPIPVLTVSTMGEPANVSDHTCRGLVQRLGGFQLNASSVEEFWIKHPVPGVVLWRSASRYCAVQQALGCKHSVHHFKICQHLQNFTVWLGQRPEA